MPGIYRSTATSNFLQAVAGEPDGVPILDPDVPLDRDLLFPRWAGFGHDPRQYVPDMAAAPLGMKTYPESDWDALYDEQEREQSSLEHLYLRKWEGENLDQNGQGYCWDYSTTAANMMRRITMNLPFVRLNGHAAASIIKGGRDEGGWCGLSLKFQREHGQAEEGDGPLQWPTHAYGRTINKRFDDREFAEHMGRYRITDDRYDLGKPEYAQQLKREQHATCLFNNQPAPSDFNWWGHSVCALRYVRIERGNWGLLILNSWKNWGRRGLAVLQGSKARPDGAVAVAAVMAA